MILELLESHTGSYLSGEEIASGLGISRTAVWKAIKKLQSEGYTIDAVTNRGYRLSAASDVLSEKLIRSYMDRCSTDGLSASAGTVRAGSAAVPVMDVFDTVDSTNTVCLRRVHSGGSGTYAAVAGGQTSGRGRRGRSFFSPDGTGLYMSILLRPAGMTSDQAMRFTTMAAVAAAEAIEAVSGRTALIKWVNDVYVDSRKVCGILTEASFNPEDGTLDYAVVGIGINVYEPEGGFPEDIRGRAGAISGPVSGPSGTIAERGGRSRLAAEILSRFLGYAEARNTDGEIPLYVAEYKRRCFVTGMDADVLKAGAAPVRAHVLGIDDECRLIVRYDDGTEETLGSGEISLKI